ncbi:hypothetical protein ONZ45_g4261 [Pleurotus djamor]|nr:hypothetical protein ONZ45_g4261 [Pleurotus djamor]
MSTPLLGILYRIQSVDFHSYIEITDLTPNILVVLRPLKDDKRQQWYLEADGASKFYIRSAAESNLYLGHINSSGVGYNTKNHCVSFYITHNDDGTFGLRSLLTGTTASERLEARLRLHYLAPPRRDGTQSRPQVYVKPQDPPKDSKFQSDLQGWHVARKPNGRYTLRNSGGGLYMTSGTPDFSQGDLITANAEEFEWEIQSIGGSFWSIKLPSSSSKEARLSAGFADGQANGGDVVSLQPSDLAKSQMWFFDKYIILGADKIQANREVPAGIYAIQNCRARGTYIWVLEDTRGWKVVRESLAYSDFHKFELEYVGETAKFTLKFVPGSNDRKIPIKVNSDMLVADETPSEFILIKKDGNAPGYFLCPADTAKKVVSLKLKDDYFSGKQGLAVDPRIDGDTSLMWTFDRSNL